jgi:hypothetical protein
LRGEPQDRIILLA